MESCIGVVRGDFKQSEVELLGEVVTELVEAVDVALDLGDGLVRGMGIACVVFAVPEIEVGLVLVKNELGKGSFWMRGGDRGVVAVKRGLVVEEDDFCSIKHKG